MVFLEIPNVPLGTVFAETVTNNNKIFKSITKSNNIPSFMNLKSLTANTEYSIANLLNQYFQAVFHDSSLFPNTDYLPSTHDSLNSITITVTDVFEALVSLDVEKSPNMNKISPRVLQSYAEALNEPLHHLVTQSIRYAILPSS